MKIILALLLLVLPASNNPENTISLRFKGQVLNVINRSEYALPPFDRVMIDQNKYLALLNDLEGKVFQEAVNATFDKNGHIISEKMGYKLNHKRFKEAFYNGFYLSGAVSVDIPIETIYPKVDSELLTSISTKKISQYTTYFNNRNTQRSHNIHLAADAIDNTVIFPGETFSFNSVVGKRTVERGYMPAPVIIKGEIAEGVGGGICQVSSTLFNAVDQAGVKIIERYTHSRRVPYVPPNRDATVSWYGPDLKFSNLYTQPLLIRSRVSGGQLIVIIYSSDTFNRNK